MGFDKFKKSIFGGESQEDPVEEEVREMPNIPVNPVPTRGLGGIENNKMIFLLDPLYTNFFPLNIKDDMSIPPIRIETE